MNILSARGFYFPSTGSMTDTPLVLHLDHYEPNEHALLNEATFSELVLCSSVFQCTSPHGYCAT